MEQRAPDIKVDAPAPNFQTPAVTNDYVVFEGDLTHETARRTVSNRFYAQVHNRGPVKATKVRVRAFFASGALGLPPLPGDFWSSGKPFVGTPSGPHWTPVGATIEIPELEPAEPGVVCWEWTVPATATKHSCLLVVATCAEDPIDGGGILDADTLVLTRKHVAVKNVNVANAVLSASSSSGEAMGTSSSPLEVIIVQMHDVTRTGTAYDLELHWASLPRGARVFVAFERPRRGGAVIRPDDEELERLDIRPAREAGTLFLPEYELGLPSRTGWLSLPWRLLPAWLRRRGVGRRRRFDLSRVYELPRPDHNSVIFPGLMVPGNTSLAVAVNVTLPAQMSGPAQFDVIQRFGERIVGGSTYLLRVPESMHNR